VQKKTLFEASVLLPSAVPNVFAFHENPHNISAIAPKTLKVLSVKAGHHAVEGETFFLRIRQFGITAGWLGVWETVTSPNTLSDVGVECPFKFWRHEHLFQEVTGGTLMVDRVALVPKGGPLIEFFAGPFFQIFLRKMFHDRHRATRKFFEEAAKN
jgi:ligand-binding SRPBCC domain-containing protein